MRGGWQISSGSVVLFTLATQVQLRCDLLLQLRCCPANGEFSVGRLPNVVLPDRERAAARVKTHVHRKSCQKDSQRSLSITQRSLSITQRSLSITVYCLCRLHSTTVFNPLGTRLRVPSPGSHPPRLVCDSPLVICVCYCISYTGWRRLIESPKLQIIFHKRETKYRALLRKMTYKDKGSYESSPPCIL